MIRVGMRRDGTDVWVNDICSNEEMNRYTCTVDEFLEEDPPKIDSVIVKSSSFTRVNADISGFRTYGLKGGKVLHRS